MKFIHLRIFSVYGADDRPGTLVDSCVNIFNKGGFLKLGHCSQMWNYLYIDDFVRVIIKFLQIDCKETIYIVAGNETRKLKEYVKKIFELSDGLGQYEFGVGEENPEKSPSLNPNISRVCKELAWRPQVDFEEGIKFIMKTKEIIE